MLRENKREEKTICVKCGSKNVVKKGFRKGKLETKQVYKCKDCGRNFTPGKIKNKTYPAGVILLAVSYYNLGNDLKKTSRLVNKRLRVKVPTKTIYSWVKEFNQVCSYHRIRNKATKLFKPEETVFRKVFRHVQLYKYLYHKAKTELFINKYFSGLKDYLVNISSKCPDSLFKNSNRSSDVRLDFDFSKIKVTKKENYACKLAVLALEAAKRNTERHEKLQEFMVVNDSVTVAAEIPVHMDYSEYKYYKFMNHDKSSPSKTITGHIDVVQLKFGLIYVLDYKPDASKEKTEKVMSQLLVYALALSKRTGIWLRNFRCAWFDDKGYYEFNPNEIILAADPNMPKWKLKEFLSDEEARLFFTSKYFHKIRASKREAEKIRGLHRKHFWKLAGEIKER